MAPQVVFPCYSIDASALIEIEKHYPEDLFGWVWVLMEQLAQEWRLFVCQRVCEECVNGPIASLLHRMPTARIDFLDMEEHYAAFVRFASAKRLQMVCAESLRDPADPYVVALALMMEARAPSDLLSRPDADNVCKVVSCEKPKGGTTKIPDVCRFMGIDHLDLFQWWRECKPAS